MDEYFHPTVYDECNYLSMLGLKLIHVSKMAPSQWQHIGMPVITKDIINYK